MAFTLNDEQRKVCHELTMEFLRQNNSLKMNRSSDKPKDGKETKKHKKGDGERIREVYFSIFEEIAVGVDKHWDRIKGEMS